MKRKTTEEFIVDAKKVHGDKYDYSKTDYVNTRTKVTIICPIHGSFEQSPNVHLQGCGCPKCAGNVIAMTKEEFIKKAQEIHKNPDGTPKYTYDKVDLAHAKVIITCPVHGDFEQLYNDHLKGCGCNKCRRTKSKEFEPIEGKKQMREYRIWKAMKNRALNPNSMDANHYINRGINICDKWKESFEAFYNDMGPCPEGYSIDRINNDGNYCPENCRWASQETQCKNRGEFNLVFTYNGETHVAKDWAKILDIKYTTLLKRLHEGYPFEEAIKKDFGVVYIEYKEESKPLKDWCKQLNLKYSTIYCRIHKHGWSIERALETSAPPFES